MSRDSLSGRHLMLIRTSGSVRLPPPPQFGYRVQSQPLMELLSTAPLCNLPLGGLLKSTTACSLEDVINLMRIGLTHNTLRVKWLTCTSAGSQAAITRAQGSHTETELRQEFRITYEEDITCLYGNLCGHLTHSAKRVANNLRTDPICSCTCLPPTRTHCRGLLDAWMS